MLARVKEQEAKNRRGDLKIVFGAAGGVGKTYAILEVGQLCLEYHPKSRHRGYLHLEPEACPR